MPYVLEVVKAGRTIETRKYYTPRYYSKGEKRRKKSQDDAAGDVSVL